MPPPPLSSPVSAGGLRPGGGGGGGLTAPLSAQGLRPGGALGSKLIGGGRGGRGGGEGSSAADQDSSWRRTPGGGGYRPTGQRSPGGGASAADHDGAWRRGPGPRGSPSSSGAGAGGSRQGGATGSSASSSVAPSAAAVPLPQLLEQWHAGGEAKLEELWDSIRLELRTPVTGKHGAASGGVAAEKAEDEHQKQVSPAEERARLLWEAVQAGAKASGSREALPLPRDVAIGLVDAAGRVVEELSLTGKDEPSHVVLRLFAHALPAAGDQARLPSALCRRLAALVKRTSSLRTCSLALQCLASAAELAPSSVLAAPQETLEAVAAAGSCVSTALVNGPSPTLGMLRDLGALLQAILPLLELVKDQLEPSALALLSSLQPCAVVGAPYVVRVQHVLRLENLVMGPGGASPAGGATATSSGTEPSEADFSGADSCTAGGGGKRRLGGGEAAATALGQQAAQCRASALRIFVQLFRLYPKAFFGRWPLVLDFQPGVSSRGTHGSGSLPLLLAICQQDPASKVRSAGLAAVVALLEAPSVKNWPVPLERGVGGRTGGGSSSSSAPAPVSSSGGSFTSLADQVAMTLRQAHSVVFELLRRPGSSESLNVLRACGDLLGCTPYPKLKPGLLSQGILALLPTLRGLSRIDSVDAVPLHLCVCVVALGAGLKREDCADELERVLFERPSAAGSAQAPPSLPPRPRAGSSAGGAGGAATPGGGAFAVDELPMAPPAEELLSVALHVANLARAHTEARLASGAGTGVGDRRGGKGASGRGGSHGGDAEGGEPALVVDLMAAASRLAALRPAAATPRAREQLQALIEALLDQPGAGLRARGRKMLEELFPARPPPGSTDIENRATARLRRPPGGLALPAGWCAKIAWRMLDALPGEAAYLVRVGTYGMLPGTALAALDPFPAPGNATSSDEAFGDGAASAEALVSKALASIRAGAADANAAVRTAAAQACGSLSSVWLQLPSAGSAAATASAAAAAKAPSGTAGGAGGSLRGPAVLELLLGLLSDTNADARSAAATAIATIAADAAAAATSSDASERPPSPLARSAGLDWLPAAEGLLALGGAEGPEKPRSAALRAVGILAEVLLADASAGSAVAKSRAAASAARPPGLSPDSDKGPSQRNEDPIVLRMARALACGARTPPPKCQWNACRAIGQVYQSSAFLLSPLRLEAHALFLDALCREAAGAPNLKVRIQATQALAQIPDSSEFWPPADADLVLRSFCAALALLGEGAGGAAALGQVEERQRTAYTKSLRTELRLVAERWAASAPPSPPPSASTLEALRSSAEELRELLATTDSVAAAGAAAAAAVAAAGDLGAFGQAPAKPGASPFGSPSRGGGGDGADALADAASAADAAAAAVAADDVPCCGDRGAGARSRLLALLEGPATAGAADGAADGSAGG